MENLLLKKQNLSLLSSGVVCLLALALLLRALFTDLNCHPLWVALAADIAFNFLSIIIGRKQKDGCLALLNTCFPELLRGATLGFYLWHRSGGEASDGFLLYLCLVYLVSLLYRLFSVPYAHIKLMPVQPL